MALAPWADPARKNVGQAGIMILVEFGCNHLLTTSAAGKGRNLWKIVQVLFPLPIALDTMGVCICVLVFLLCFGGFFKWTRLMCPNLISCEGAEANRAPKRLCRGDSSVPHFHTQILIVSCLVTCCWAG